MDLVLSSEQMKDKYKDNDEINDILGNVADDAEDLMKALGGIEDTEDPILNDIDKVHETEQTNNEVPQQSKQSDISEEDALKSMIAMEGSINAIDSGKITQELANFAIEFNKRDLSNIPVQFRTKDVCLTALKGDISQFKDIPTSLINRDFIIECININKNIVKYIGSQYLDVEIIDKILLQKPELIRDIPDNIRPSTNVLNTIVKQVDKDTKEYMIDKFGGKRKQVNEDVPQSTTSNNENQDILKRLKLLEDRVKMLESKLGGL